MVTTPARKSKPRRAQEAETARASLTPAAWVEAATEVLVELVQVWAKE